ncbi:sce7725 family protein [Corynebacterium simulans]|uniref:sce7725 family protein n=1 Tax=Corynebacterium simulans TaxID=146827 RepID=UPI001EF38B71|nr:sce7725 family protein [Corynebacterium simulans]MCG7248624.1 sce7725 family protein [Corynebacterium simulans]
MTAYWPYFRGKQFELLALREVSNFIDPSKINPIVEPVKYKLDGLFRMMLDLASTGIPCSIVINPQVGDYSKDWERFFSEYLEMQAARQLNGIVHPTILLSPAVDLSSVRAMLDRLQADFTFTESREVHFVNKKFADIYQLSQLLENYEFDYVHVLEEPNYKSKYNRYFSEPRLVLLEDPFDKRKNADYLDIPIEPFSETFNEYALHGFEGFGDYSIVGKDFSDSGGPAWAVAIHLTFLEDGDFPMLWVQHFVSDDNDSPSFPAEKFSQALEKLIKATEDETKFGNTRGIAHFKNLYDNGHFPGLGQVKKYSMIHHMETVTNQIQGSID